VRSLSQGFRSVVTATDLPCPTVVRSARLVTTLVAAAGLGAAGVGAPAMLRVSGLVRTGLARTGGPAGVAVSGTARSTVASRRGVAHHRQREHRGARLGAGTPRLEESAVPRMNTAARRLFR
jgi:hypothetical protein